jgi:uncharacterized cupin superfamily protein
MADDDAKSPHYLSAESIQTTKPTRNQHQFNASAVRMTRTLGEPTGMNRIGVHLVTVEPGNETTQHHYHDADEEFIYILEGHGEALIGDEVIKVGPGDFMGFPAPSPAHSMRNTSDASLVYLMGGERNLPDVVHYPLIQRSMIKDGHTKRWVDWENLHDV